MENSLTIALAQTTILPDPEGNLQKAEKLIAEAAEQGAELVVFPEMFMALPRANVDLATIAQPLSGPFVSTLSNLAEKNSISIICGLWEKVDGEEERAANVAVAIDSNGDLLARYNKIHLFDALSVRESDNMIGGNTAPPIFTIKSVKLGLAICYDLRFPELFRNLVTKGAQAVIVPAAWYAGPLKEEHWLTLLRARAIENTMYVCGANLCGSPFSARSVIYDPFGAEIAGSGESEALIYGCIKPERIEEVRTKLPALTHMRREIFNE